MPCWSAEASQSTAKDLEAKARLRHRVSYSTRVIFLGLRRPHFLRRLQVSCRLWSLERVQWAASRARKGINKYARSQSRNKLILILADGKVTHHKENKGIWEIRGSPWAAPHAQKRGEQKMDCFHSHVHSPNLVLPLLCFLVCSFVFCEFDAYLSCVRNSNCPPVYRKGVLRE